MIEWHGGLKLNISKKIINKLDYNRETEFKELEKSCEGDFSYISKPLLMIHLGFLKSSGWIRRGKGYKLSMSGQVFKHFSSPTEDLTPIEKYMFADRCLEDELFYDLFSYIYKNSMNIYKSRTLREVVLESYKKSLKKSNDKKNLERLKNLEEYQNDYNKLSSKEKINSKFYHYLRHIGGGVLEIMQQLDFIFNIYKGLYRVNPELRLSLQQSIKDDFHEVLIDFYFPHSKLPIELEIEEEIIDFIEEFEKYLPISLQDLEKAVVYKSLKENFRVSPSKVEEVIKKSILSNKIFFKKIGDEIFITGI